MRILAIGIHPDDVEIGCGGTCAVLVARGHEVTILDLTRGEASTNGTPEQRAREAEQAARNLGVQRRWNAGLPDTGVRSDDPEQLRAVVALLRRARPHVVLIPHADDPHPDHAAGSMLSQHAVFLCNVNGYVTEADGHRQERWRVSRSLVYPGRRDVRADVVVDVTAVYETKRASIRAHASQLDAGEASLSTPLNDPRFLPMMEARDRLAGRRVGVTFGEAYQLLAPIVVTDFAALVPPEA